MNVYVTLTQLKQYLGPNSGVTPFTADAENGRLLEFCVKASRVFDAFVTNGVQPTRKFYPTLETRYFDHPGSEVNLGSFDTLGGTLMTRRPGSNVLYLDQDLVEIVTLTTRNAGVTITSADYLPSQDGNHNVRPYDMIALQPNGTYTVFDYVNTPHKANAVTGWWCWHDDWANAWQDTGDTVQSGPLVIDGTTLTVTDVDGADIMGLPYRFKIGGTYKIEDEIIWVIDGDTTAQTLTILRGKNGTTAAAHADGTPIYEYKPPMQIVNAMEAFVALMYKRPDSVGDEGSEQATVTNHGTVLAPSSMPREIKDILSKAGLVKEDL